MTFTTGTLLKTLQRDGVLKPGKALDLGCGEGRDTVNLTKEGFMVDAVDQDAEALSQIPILPTIFPINSKIENYKIKENYYNLVSCQYVLQFLLKENARNVIKKMIAGTIPQGIISFNLIGEKDEWKNKWTTWTREEADTFLSTLPVKIYKVITEEGMGMTRGGSLKYWHVFNYVLIKK